MKIPTLPPRQILVAILSLSWFIGPCASAVPEDAQAPKQTEAPVEIKSGVVAEIWPLERPVGVSVRRAFEMCRSQKPREIATTLPLGNFEIPARPAASLVRVRGVLSAPETFSYAFIIDGADPAELWMEDADGVWTLAQREGNPNKRVGSIKMEQGVPRHFEFWTMGSSKIAVQWDAVKWETKTSRRVIAEGVVPASRMTAPAAKPGERSGDGLRYEWKQRWGLDLASNDGPNEIFGDPDGDGLVNWQEQLAGTDPLKADCEGRAGFLRWEIWRGIPGKFVFDLTRSGNFPQHPDEVRYLNRLEIPVGYGNDYGSRVRGLIKAPADGEYTFMLIADDTAEFWLGETQSSASRKLIARVEQSGPQAKWTRRSEQVEKPLFPEQVSAPIALRKGQTYYLEILHKQSAQIDHCSAAWILPGERSPQVIAANALISWQRDAADLLDTGLPDAWLLSSGLMADGVDPANRTAYADPDFDGISNLMEWRGGTDPLKAEAVETKHMLTCESWTELTGNQISLLTSNPRFPGQPTHRTLVDNFDFSDEGANYGSRLRGYVTAPDDGPYVFNIAGNHACNLYLSKSEDKFTKHLVAQTTKGTDWRSFGANASSESEPVILSKGQRYYIEVLFKRGARQEPAASKRDHASIAWKRPGRLETVIDAAYLSPYRKDPRDWDDDALLDEWEQAHGLNPQDPMGAQGAYGDPDGDWLDNLQEQQLGLDPTVSDVHGTSGLALFECWENISGKMSDLKANSAFPLHPSQRKWITSLEGPQAFADNYGSRLRAYLVPPSSGDYTFAIAGDNECELWLSTSELKYYKQRIAFVSDWSGFREWDKEPGQISRPVRLEAGKRYFIEILHHQATKSDHVSAALRGPGTKDFEVIKGAALEAFAGDPSDTNDNDIPDDYELACGMSPDGRDADKDLDGDGLTNRQEFLLGTRANLKDSDEDGVNDGDEIHIYHSNPLVKDTPPPVLEKTAPLAQWSGTPGSWMVGADGTLNSMARRGEASWDVEVAAPGVYLIEVVANARGATAYVPPVPVTILIDDLETLRGQILASEQPTRLAGLTRALAAGKHHVTLFNRNVRSGVGISIVSVNLYRHEGVDADTDGIPDWLENLCGRTDQVAQGQLESAVSPACIEGEARFSDDVSLSVDGVAILAQEGLRGKWFADVPLDSATPVELKAAFEGGAIIEPVSVRWVPTNLMTCPDVLRLRAGDALLLTAFPEGAIAQAVTFEVKNGADAACSGTADQAQQVAFAKAGREVLSVTAGTPQGTKQTRTVTVEVCAAGFGDGFSVAVDYPRSWELPLVSRDLVIESDSWLTLTEQATMPPAARAFTATATVADSARVLARLWQQGPVLAATFVNGFRFATASETGNYNVIQVLSDGTRVVEVRYVIDGVIPKNLSVWLHLYVTDAIFANGDTWYELTAKDFTDSGEARLLIYKAPGVGNPYVCHWIKPFYQKSPAEEASGQEPVPSGP